MLAYRSRYSLTASFIKAQNLSCFVYDNEFEESFRKNGLFDYSIKRSVLKKSQHVKFLAVSLIITNNR